MTRFVFSSTGSSSNVDGGVYATDGTAAGTVEIGQYQGQLYSSDIIGVGPEFDGKAFFLEQDYAGDGAENTNLISTDGTVAGTSLVLTLANDDTATPYPSGIWQVGKILLAAGAINGAASSAQVTPGLMASTDGVTFTPITSGISASSLVAAGGIAYFAATDENGNNAGLWRTDGTTAGTININPPAMVLDPVNITPLGDGGAVFANQDPAGGPSTLWYTGGTFGSTSEIDNAGSGSPSVVSVLTNVGTATVGGQAIFGAIDSFGNYSVWATDGTPAGSREIFDGGNAGSATRPILGVTAWGDKVIITSGYGLFVTDTAGTDSVSSINPWPQYGATPPGDYTTLGNRIIMTSPSVNYDGVDEPVTLYVSDGTQAGTVALNIPGLETITSGLTVVGKEVVFEATDLSGKQAFFATDGTAAGSHELAVAPAVSLDPTVSPVIEALPVPTNAAVITLGGGNQSALAISGDTVQAGSGNDTITASAGNVTVLGSSGHLTFFGGAAASSVSGASGSATIFGGSGGGVYVAGKAGHNVMISQGTAGVATTLTGMGANDQIFGSASGNDTLNGGSGRDTILGGDGSTVINGGGTGSVIFTGGITTVNGGTGGKDTVVGGNGTLGMTAQNGDAVFGGAGALNVAGSLTGADSIVGGSGALNVAGRGGNMLVVGGTSTSNVSVGNGASLVFAGSGSMSLIGGAGSMQVMAGSGATTVIEGTGPTTLQVAKGNAGGADVISGFRPGLDTVDLFGYQPSQQSVATAQGSTTISLIDGTKVTLLGVSDPLHSIVG